MTNRVMPAILGVLFTLACIFPALSPSATDVDQSQTQNTLPTAIAQTVAAARSQTASAAPSATVTPTPTLVPTSAFTGTPTVPTATRTEIPVYVSATSIPTTVPTATKAIPTSAAQVSSDSGVEVPTEKLAGEWTCIITARSPANGLVAKAKQVIEISWTVRNTGTKTWTRNGVDFVFQRGIRHVGGRIQDFPTAVGPGGTINFKVSIEAPKQAKSYNVVWALQVGNYAFCEMKFSFSVG